MFHFISNMIILMLKCHSFHTVPHDTCCTHIRVSIVFKFMHALGRQDRTANDDHFTAVCKKQAFDMEEHNEPSHRLRQQTSKAPSFVSCHSQGMFCATSSRTKNKQEDLADRVTQQSHKPMQDAILVCAMLTKNVPHLPQNNCHHFKPNHTTVLQ